MGRGYPAKAGLHLMVWVVLLQFAALYGQEMPPVRDGLRPVPLPDLGSIEAPVADQLRSAFRAVEEAGGPRSSRDTVAAVYGSLGRLCHAYELFDCAEAAYVNAGSLESRRGTWPYLLGYLFQQTGRLEDAESQFWLALQLDPARREAAARRADVYLRQNRLRQARDAFQELREVFPAFAASGLGEIALRERRFKDAVEHLRAALARAPEATALHYSLAMAYRGLGRLDEARAELERRGAGIVKIGDPEVDGLSALTRGERLLLIRGKAAFDAGELPNAVSWFTKAIADAPGSVAARTQLATTFVRLGELEKAIEQFEAVLRIDPGNQQTAIDLAIVLSDRGRFRDAVAVLTRALAEADLQVGLSGAGSPQSHTTATTLARLLAAAPDRSVRDGARALELARTVFDKEPSSAHAETVALALAELERCGEARDWMLKAISMAEQTGDTAEAARLKGQLPRYAANGCR
jgi:tetratricopeptide (TPR) repeat protein